MSDSFRKDLGDKVGETVTPQSEKSTLDKAKEGVTDTTDKLAGQVQPGDQKSLGQQASDTLSGKPGEKGIVEQVQEAGQAAYEYAANTATDVYNKVADATSGEKK